MLILFYIFYQFISLLQEVIEETYINKMKYL